MTRSTVSRGNGWSRRIESALLPLALGIGGVVATNDWASSKFEKFPQVQPWLLAVIVFVAITALSFLAMRIVLALSRALIEGLAPLYYIWATPRRIAERIPSLLVRASPEALPDGIGERVASRIVERIIRPALPSLDAAIERAGDGARALRNMPEISIDRMTGKYLEPYLIENSNFGKVVYVDPLHGSIEFGAEFGWLLRHPLVQRLNEVRQLAFAFPRYPGGTHTRFSHSLGVAHLAKTAVKGVLDSGVLYTDRGVEPIDLDAKERERLINLSVACGLVHDLGHPPLGHTLDRFFRSRFFVGEATSDADKSFLPKVLDHLQECLRAVGTSKDEIVRILEGTDLTAWEVFLSQLLNSKLDVDRLDYLQRDAHFTGQREGILNIHALLSAIRPYKSGANIHLTFDGSYLSDVEQFVYARDVMYLRCYEHAQKVVSEALAARCVKKFFDSSAGASSKVERFGLLTDGQLIELFDESLAGDKNSQKVWRDIFRSGALSYSQIDSVPFSHGDVEGRLEHLLADFTVESGVLVDKITEIERLTAEAAGVHPEDVLLVLPDPKANEERSIGLDIRILVRSGDGYEAVPLLNEENDNSPSEVLRRRKYVASELALAALTLEEVKAAAKKGISFLGILRSARFRLRLFVHTRSLDSSVAVKTAFRSLGAKELS